MNTDPVYSGVEDKVEFYLYLCYSGNQLQRLIAKAFYYYIFNCGDFADVLFFRTTTEQCTKAQMFHLF